MAVVCKIESEKITHGFKIPYEIRENLTKWDSDLSELTYGYGVFDFTPNLTSFNGNLGKLRSAYCMFASSGITSWDVDLPSLIYGGLMFRGCYNLTSFSGDLGNLVSGKAEGGMFADCVNLTDFNSNLSSLKTGANMFAKYSSDGYCPLTAQSIQNIANGINDISTLDKTNENNWKYIDHNPPSGDWESTIYESERGRIDLGWDGNGDITSAIQTMQRRGWDVYVNGELQEVLVNPADIIEGSAYIPDASKWNEEVYTPNNLTIVSVVDGVAYDGLV